MDRIRRNERLAAMTRILVESPNKIFTLGTFCEMFGAARISTFCAEFSRSSIWVSWTR